MPDEIRADYAQYYAEKLWEMIPAIYRHEDGISDRRDVLRAFAELLAQQAALIRKSHDRLWEDQFIELCDDWAVPYLGDLVGSRLLSALDSRAQRVDVAKTIYYRRRKGTIRLLEELISDITGWQGTVVENFRRLGRTRHGLDPEPKNCAGHFSCTLPGGTADIRSPRGSALAGGPFDKFHYTPDMRKHCGSNGRYGIPKIAFHIYRLQAFKVDQVPAAVLAGKRRFLIDPSGRDIQLFMPQNRPQDAGPDDRRRQNWERWRLAREWELPGPMQCRLLNDAGGGKQGLVGDAQQAGKAIQVEQGPDSIVSPDDIEAADLTDWNINNTDKRLIIDPKLGRLLFVGDPPAGPVRVTYHYGFPGQIGAGTYERRQFLSSPPDIVRSCNIRRIRQSDGSYLQEDVPQQDALASEDFRNEGVTQLQDCARYTSVSNRLAIKQLVVQAANGKRPYLELGSNWILRAGGEDEKGAELVLDGIWIGGQEGQNVVLQNSYDRVVIRHVTLDPGGSFNESVRRAPVTLQVEGDVKELIIDRSILGPIQLSGHVESCEIKDSIIQSIDEDVPALEATSGLVKMNSVTVFGGMKLHRLQASEVLATDVVEVMDTQHGCFRFGAALQGSILPRTFHSELICEWKPYFVSHRIGDPGYAQLSAAAPEYIQQGAESGSEIGAWSFLLNPIKQDGLRKKVEEYMPFGLIPLFIQET